MESNDQNRICDLSIMENVSIDKFDFGEIKEYLQNQRYPEWCAGDRGRKANFRRKASNFSLQNAELVFIHKATRKSREGRHLRVIIDVAERRNIVKMCHEGCATSTEAKALGGHIGRDKTLGKIMERFWWPGVKDDVSLHVSSCDRCQRSSKKFMKSNAELNPIAVPSAPFRQIGVDLCSLPTTPDGYCCIVVIVDYFTKWMEAKPLKDKTAKSVATFLYETICRHGVPQVQINDQGREFVNQVSSELHRLTGVQQRVTSAYHPQANGLVERSNQTIQRSLLKTLEGRHQEWPQALPGILFAFNTSRQKSTGFSAFYLLYGRNAVLPIDVKVDEDVSPTPDDSPIDAESLQARLASFKNMEDVVYQQTASNIKTSQDRQKMDYQRRNAAKQVFAVGDDVLLWNNRRADRKGGKEQDPWKGPYVINRVLDKGLYELRSATAVLKCKANGSNLKPYKRPEEDVEVLVVGEDVSQLDFNPTDATWRATQCERLALPLPRSEQPSRSKGTLHGEPTDIDQIRGDGNCLFRAVSKEVTGSERHHGQIRAKVVDLMQDNRYKGHFESYCGHPDMSEYVEESRMSEHAVWATDVEIVAIASLLNTPIVVHTENSSRRSWLCYEPVCVVPPLVESEQRIYLTNYHEHFNRVCAV